MHYLVEMQHLTRKEFLRGLQGVSDEDARRRVEPMNCMTWIIGHLAAGEHATAAWPQGRGMEPQYRPFVYGAGASQPPLEEVMTLWRTACTEADDLLRSADDKRLRQPIAARGEGWEAENLGTAIVHLTFHYWSHIGEISAIRQMLGHPRPPQFVDMHGWQYGESQPG